MTTLADAIATPAGVNINGAVGRLAAAASKSVALATDDSASLTAIAAAAADTTTPSPVKIDQTTPGTTNAASISHIGSTAVASGNGVVGAGVQRVAIASDNSPVPVSVQQPCDVINYVPVLDTAAYAAGDVLAATAVISNVMRANDGRGLLVSLTGIDKSKNKPAMTILFYQTNVTSAAVNAANALSDADQLNLLGFHRILAADWIDYANNSICGFKGPTAPGLLLEAASGTKDVYAVCILDAGTPTFAVGDLMFKLGVVQS